MSGATKYRARKGTRAWPFCIPFLIGLICAACAGQRKLAADEEAARVFTDTLAILSFNDFHGAFAADEAIPGAACLTRTVLDERRRYPRAIVVTGGDNLSGSYFSKMTKGEPFDEMSRTMGVEMSAIGNHEFDWGLAYLRDTAARRMPYVAANITQESDGRSPDWLAPYRIVERRLRDGSLLRVAFVGLTTTETPLKTTRAYVSGLRFVNPSRACERTIARLRQEERVDLIVVLAHIGTDMRDPRGFVEDDARDLPFIEGVDAIISGHTHEVVLRRVNDVPIVQAGVNGSHVGKLLFLIRDSAGIRRVDYMGGDTIRVAGSGHPAIRQAVGRIMDRYGLSEVLATAGETLTHDWDVNSLDFTPVGALVTSAYVHCFRERMPAYADVPVVGVNHFGGIRASLPQGPITRLRAGNVLPFGSPVVAYRFDGKRLRRLLEEGRRPAYGYLQASDLTLTFEGERIRKMVYTGGGQAMEIADDTPCVVVLDAFITNGGDGYDASLFTGYGIEAFNSLGIVTTDAFFDYLRALREPVTTESTRMPVISVENRIFAGEKKH